MKPQLKPEFINFFNTSVKPLAEKCANLFPLIQRVENGYTPTDEETKQLSSATDTMAHWYVGLLVADVNKAIFDGASFNLINSLSTVSGTLTSESYWNNVWGDKQNNEEAQELKKLAGLVSELTKFL